MVLAQGLMSLQRDVGSLHSSEGLSGARGSPSKMALTWLEAGGLRSSPRGLLRGRWLPPK